jgi:hypothetical protein
VGRRASTIQEFFSLRARIATRGELVHFCFRVARRAFLTRRVVTASARLAASHMREFCVVRTPRNTRDSTLAWNDSRSYYSRPADAKIEDVLDRDRADSMECALDIGDGRSPNDQRRSETTA